MGDTEGQHEAILDAAERVLDAAIGHADVRRRLPLRIMQVRHGQVFAVLIEDMGPVSKGSEREENIKWEDRGNAAMDCATNAIRTSEPVPDSDG